MRWYARDRAGHIAIIGGNIVPTLYSQSPELIDRNDRVFRELPMTTTAIVDNAYLAMTKKRSIDGRIAKDGMRFNSEFARRGLFVYFQVESPEDADCDAVIFGPYRKFISPETPLTIDSLPSHIELHSLPIEFALFKQIPHALILDPEEVEPSEQLHSTPEDFT